MKETFKAQYIMLTILCQHNILCFLLTFIMADDTLLISGVKENYVNHAAADADRGSGRAHPSKRIGGVLDVSGNQKRRRCSRFYFD